MLLSALRSTTATARSATAATTTTTTTTTAAAAATTTKLFAPRRAYSEIEVTREQQLAEWTSNKDLAAWIDEHVKLCKPSRLHLCDGSQEEYDMLIQQQVATGALVALDQKKRPGCYLARSTREDVARVEERTYICSESKIDAGPMNNWADPVEMHEKMQTLFDGCMVGRTMYAIPFSMGPVGGPLSEIGVQLTDSPYVVCNMRIMTRIGADVITALGSRPWVHALHSLGAPLQPGQQDSTWPCNPEKYIVHFPEQRSIMSYGSGYGGNALLGKKCFALRIASVMARDNGWLAEHMLIIGVTNPAGVKKYFAAAFPSACGKTNLAMMLPKIDGWKVECVGDDIAWMRYGPDGRLWAINPEAGFFGVAPGTSEATNPNAMRCIDRNTLFTNVAMTGGGDVWWEGMGPKPERATSWLRRDWRPSSRSDAAHPNSRFTTPASNCPVIDADWQKPEGVPIEAIIFGGRRSTMMPLVFEAFDWAHGVYLGSSMQSETTAAAAGQRGVLRADPFAMKPFCGYNMGDYFAHWLKVGGAAKDPALLPRVYHVNWFRKQDGRFLWPGFGDNARVLKWIFERCAGDGGAVDSAVGRLPAEGALDMSGLNVPAEDMRELFAVHKDEWQAEVSRSRDFIAQIGERYPEALKKEVTKLQERIDKL